MGFLPSLSTLLLGFLAMSSLSGANSSPNRHRRRATSTCPTSGVVGAYWPAWSTVSQSPAQIPWSNLNLAFYFSVDTTSSGLSVPASQTTSDIKLFVMDAHAAKKKALFSVGGWTGSVYFSSLVATSTSRTAFAKTILNFTTTYGFDGVDLDWEFVGRQGAGSNVVSSTDASNLLTFLGILRATMGSSKIIHASVPTSGFTGSNGAALTNTKPYAAYFDYITVMAYDYYASAWSPTTGPNAPLQQCNAKSGSVASSVAYWINSGFPACQILLGVAGYSHLFKTASKQLATTTFNNVKSTSFQNFTGVSQPTDPTYTYNQLIAHGWLSSNGTAGAGGFTRYWDACTSTPFLFNSKTRIFIAYDDVQSTGLKAQWVKAKGLAGVNFYDSTGPNTAVFAAARAGLNGSFKASRKRGLERVGKSRSTEVEERTVFESYLLVTSDA